MPTLKDRVENGSVPIILTAKNAKRTPGLRHGFKPIHAKNRGLEICDFIS